jgi:hypothetical protein
MAMMTIEGTPELSRYRCSILIWDVGRVECLGVVAPPIPSEKIVIGTLHLIEILVMHIVYAIV